MGRQWFQESVEIDLKGPASSHLEALCTVIEQRQLPPLYVIIDEHDNFANHLIVHHKDRLYQDLITLKEGRKTGAISNVFITGVLPITIDELASGFNIATFLTLDTEFEHMLGFTQSEVDRLLDDVYHDYEIEPATRREVEEVIKHQYNGYHLITADGEALYNSTMLMYFLRDFTRYKTIPEYLTDMNLKTDLSWVQRITGAHSGDTEAFVDHLMTDNTIAYSKDLLTSKFNMS